jgi:hypothetical protein
MKTKNVLYYLFSPILWLFEVVLREPESDDWLNESGVPRGLYRLGFRLDGDNLVMPARAEGYQSISVGNTLVVTDRNGHRWDIPGAKLMVPRP